MPNDPALREHLTQLLTGSHAHADFNAAVNGLPVAQRGRRPAGLDHSPWELVEHLRIAQYDILDFSRNPGYKALDWPREYWPAAPEPPDEHAWDKSVQAFRHDLKALCDLVNDESNDLYAKFPWGDGQTLLREALLDADHNAYHVGQIILVRKLLGAWE